MSHRLAVANDRRPSWRPSWPHLREALALSAVVLAIFVVVYGGCDWLTGVRTRHHVHLPWELNIPLVPAMIVPYLSLNGLCILTPFILRTSRELRALAAAMIVTILAAGVGFLLLPAELAFPEPAGLGPWEAPFALADCINLRYNLVPSLHVALAVVCVEAFAAASRPLGKLVFWTWGLAIVASTVLTHQHHLLDVATGLLLALAINRVVYRAWAKNQREERPTATVR